MRKMEPKILATPKPTLSPSVRPLVVGAACGVADLVAAREELVEVVIVDDFLIVVRLWDERVDEIDEVVNAVEVVLQG